MNRGNTILVVEDEDRIRRLIKMYLGREGYVLEEAENGTQALQMIFDKNYDLIILDLMLPGIDGLSICEETRKKKATPIIMLTARGEEGNRVEGFEAGADDYVVKPFSPRELVHRVKAVLRRASATAFLSTDIDTHHVIVLPELTIDHDAHKVKAGDTVVTLTPKEYELLYYLAKSPDKVFSRETLLRDVWDYEFFGDLRTVDTHVKRLREKLNRSSPKAASMITTVWGVGYKLEVPKE
jgi:two-component system, OmpR family, response regulator ResD